MSFQLYDIMSIKTEMQKKVRCRIWFCGQIIFFFHFVLRKRTTAELSLRSTGHAGDQRKHNLNLLHTQCFTSFPINNWFEIINKKQLIWSSDLIQKLYIIKQKHFDPTKKLGRNPACEWSKISSISNKMFMFVYFSWAKTTELKTTWYLNGIWFWQAAKIICIAFCQCLSSSSVLD